MAKQDDILVDFGAIAKHIATSVMRHLYVFIAIFVLIVAASFAVALFSSHFYKSKTKIVYQSSKQSKGQTRGDLVLLGFAYSSDEEPPGYLKDIIFSQPVLSSILTRKWLPSSSAGPKPDSVLLEDFWKIEADTTAKNWELRKHNALLGKLSKYISFEQDKKTFVITLSTEFEDPQIAYDANKFLLQELNNALVRKMNYKASESRGFIEERLAEVKVTLKAAEDTLKYYRLHYKLREDLSERLEEERRQRIVLFNQEIMLELQRQYEMARIEEMKDLPVLSVIDPPMLPIKKSKPKRMLIILGGTAAAFFIAVMFSVSIDFLPEVKKWLKN